MREMSIPDAFAQAIRHYRSGNLEGAEKICKIILQASQHDKEVFEALRMLSAIMHRQKRYEEAKVHLEKAIVLEPNNPELYNNLSEISNKLEKPLEAEKAARQAISIQPNYAGAENNLGNALKEQDRLDEAADAYRRSLEIRPNDAKFQNNLGNVSKLQGRLDEAIAAYVRVLEIDPNHADTQNDLGLALHSQGRLEEAVRAYRQALILEPNFAGAENNLGNALMKQGRLDEAIEAYRRAIEIQPGLAEAENNRGNALRMLGQPQEAGEAYRRALDIDPNQAEAHSNLLFLQQYFPSVTLAGVASAHEEWDRRHAEPLNRFWQPPTNDRSPDRSLRIGFVSADFRCHAVGYFFVRCLENLVPERCETFCYSNRSVKDPMTVRITAAAGTWRDVFGLTDDTLAERIRKDGIDILVDLSGHTAGHRLLVFARKPAPIQITWLGYVGTTGLSAMDHLLADRFLVPEEKENYYREKVLRLPDGYACYDPPPDAPDVVPLPALSKGHVTFGSFNTLAKLSPQVISVWVEILRLVPNSRLVLKHRGFNSESSKRRYSKMFEGHGIDPDRLEMMGWLSSGAIAMYNRLDLALDPFPYTGSTTTCDALWMGVPVITVPGETFASRQSLTHLSNVGLTEVIAWDLSQYVEIAVGLANDFPRLAKLRAGLRERMARSPLCDGKRFAENVMKVLRGVWREWCASAANSSPN